LLSFNLSAISKRLRKPIVFYPFVSFEPDGNVHDSGTLKLKKCDLPIVGSTDRFAKQ
jgi:hypothetical protein